jgi:hypothetical protein
MTVRLRSGLESMPSRFSTTSRRPRNIHERLLNESFVGGGGRFMKEKRSYYTNLPQGDSDKSLLLVGWLVTLI